MKSTLSMLIAAGALFIASAASAAQPLPAGSIQVAAGGSCSSFYSTCASRCKTRNPSDKNCVSDHCAPKLSECRSTGCWQEGSAYGGGKTCGLSK